MRATELLKEASSPKNELTDLVRKTNNTNLLTKLLDYLSAKVKSEEPAPEPEETPSPQTTITEPVKEDVSGNLKSQVLSMLGKLDDSSPEWEKIIGVLRKDELAQLASKTVQIKLGTINGHLDKKLRDMVLRTKAPFEQKEEFLELLASGSGFFDGKALLASKTGNLYSMTEKSPVARILAQQMALQFAGAMGYGPDQGPGEMMMALLGKNIALATKGDLKIGDRVIEVKATGKGAKGLSGGRLYSTTGYGSNTMIKRELYNNLVAAGVPKDVLAQYGLPNKEPGEKVIRGGLNLNISGLTNLSDIFKTYLDQKTAKNIMNVILNGLYTKLPNGMGDPILNLVKNDGTFDPTQFLIELTKLAHSYYMMLEGHDTLMLFNSDNGNYALISSPDEIETLMSKGIISLTAHLDLNDDRGKGSSQLIIK